MESTEAALDAAPWSRAGLPAVQAWPQGRAPGRLARRLQCQVVVVVDDTHEREPNSDERESS